MDRVTVFGGSGFLGRRIVRRLAEAGAEVRVAVRDPDRVAADGRVEAVRADIRDRAAVAAALAGAGAVVNAVSLYVERGAATFAAIHEHAAGALAQEAAASGVARLVLISGIGADPHSPSRYIRARGRGEVAVATAFPAATIVRPTVMFGAGDGLFATLDGLAGFLPALPLIGGGATRLQPVHVDNVAEAVVRILDDPATAGRSYELGGPRVYTLRELVALTLRLGGRRRALIPLPFALAELPARLMAFLPRPPLTVSQLDLLRIDSVAGGTLPGLADLGIAPDPAEEVVPRYIGPSGARDRAGPKER